MDQIKTGELICALRKKIKYTQLELAEQLGVSDKAVSKWERGVGSPDISLLPSLAKVLNVDVKALLNGSLNEKDMSSGNIRKLKFYICPSCGNIVFSFEESDVSCCGMRLSALATKSPDDAHRLKIEDCDGGWYISSSHEMKREHYIAFVAVLSADSLFMKKLYPEWSAEVFLPYKMKGQMFWYCTESGLFTEKLQ